MKEKPWLDEKVDNREVRRDEILIAELMNVKVFWDVTPCWLVNYYGTFRVLQEGYSVDGGSKFQNVAIYESAWRRIPDNFNRDNVTLRRVRVTIVVVEKQ